VKSYLVSKFNIFLGGTFFYPGTTCESTATECLAITTLENNQQFCQVCDPDEPAFITLIQNSTPNFSQVCHEIATLPPGTAFLGQRTTYEGSNIALEECD